jgi:hypothetical protein
MNNLVKHSLIELEITFVFIVGLIIPVYLISLIPHKIIMPLVLIGYIILFWLVLKKYIDKHEEYLYKRFHAKHIQGFSFVVHLASVSLIIYSLFQQYWSLLLAACAIFAIVCWRDYKIFGPQKPGKQNEPPEVIVEE